MSRKHSRSGRSHGKDDLTLIKNIDSGIEARLKSAGILTFSDLSVLNPEEVLSKMGEASGLSADLIAREDWTGQAKVLAARRLTAQFVVELLLNEDQTVKTTRVRHMESGDEGQWDGWDEPSLAGFLIGRGKVKVVPMIATRMSNPEQTENRAKLEELYGQLPARPFDEFNLISRDTGKRTRIIRAGQPFELRLKLGKEQVHFAENETYEAYFYARNLDTNSRCHLGGVRGTIQPGGADLTIVKAVNKTLESGTYRIEANLGSESGPKHPSHGQTEIRGELICVC